MRQETVFIVLGKLHQINDTLRPLYLPHFLQAAETGATPRDREEEGASVGGVVKGFDFDALLARKPELKPELTTLRDQFMTSDEEETVKVCVRSI